MKYFVTGTDTGAGKTFVTAAIATRGISRGMSVFAFKPVETGCEPGQLGSDQQLLIQAAGNWQTNELAGLYRLGLPVSPLVAAEAEDLVIDIVRIADIALHTPADLALIEGAGGWRVPITRTIDMAGLARTLSCPIIVVARAGLGTINHSLLTLEAIERDGLDIAALVVSRRPEDSPSFTASNVAQISSRWPGHIITLADDASVLDVLL